MLSTHLMPWWSLCLAGSIVLTSGALAAPLEGTVVNKTTNKPAAGDEVALLRLAQGMQELTHTTTDRQGHFSIEAPDPEGIYLIRVTHDKANYFQPLDRGARTTEVVVYTASPKVEGLVEEADVLKIQTDPGAQQLSVIEMFFLKNTSSPPKTQFSDRPFEFQLPAGAVVESSVALGPGGMPVRSAPVPLGEPNHFAFIFPLRPGETRFQVSYKVPYSGSFNFAPQPAIPTGAVAVVLPNSMKFAAGQGATYAHVTEETDSQAYAVNNVLPSQPLGFIVSGTGQLPRDSDAASSQGAGGQPEKAADTRPGGGLGVPVDPTGESDPWAKYKWWILGVLGLIMAAGAGITLRPSKQNVKMAPEGENPNSLAYPTPTALGSTPLVGAPPSGIDNPSVAATLNVLRDEMFTLETEHMQSLISEEIYVQQKSALEVVLRRTLGRVENTR